MVTFTFIKCFNTGGLALCLRGSTEERGQIIFDMVNLAKQ